MYKRKFMIFSKTYGRNTEQGGKDNKIIIYFNANTRKRWLIVNI